MFFQEYYKSHEQQAQHFVGTDIDVTPIKQLRMRVIKIVTFKGGHLMW